MEQVPMYHPVVAQTSVASIVARKAIMPQKIAKRDNGIRVVGHVLIAAKKGILPKIALIRPVDQ